jgi:hypothetical protein
MGALFQGKLCDWPLAPRSLFPIHYNEVHFSPFILNFWNVLLIKFDSTELEGNRYASLTALCPARTRSWLCCLPNKQEVALEPLLHWYSLQASRRKVQHNYKMKGRDREENLAISSWRSWSYLSLLCMPGLTKTYSARNIEQAVYNVTHIGDARQQLAKHVPKRYAANKNRRPLLDNWFGYHGTKRVSGTTHTYKTDADSLKAVSSIQFAWVYKMRPDQTKTERVNQLVRISQPQELSQLASHSGREDARSPGGNGTSLRQSPIVSCYKWL